MQLLLNDRFAPITSSIGFIQCPAKVATEAYVEWMKPIQAGRTDHVTGKSNPVSLRVEHGVKNLAEMLATLFPLTTVERRRMLFVQTTADWTAFFDNGLQGTDVFSAVSYLCQQIKCKGVKATQIPH